LIAVAAATSLALAACGDSDNGNGNSNGGNGGSSGEANAQKAIDINPQPRDKVKDGGTVRWAIEQFSTQWNYNQLNGPESSTLDVLTSLMPQPLVADEKANTEPDPNFIESAEVTSNSPETIKYVLNDMAKWSDGSPITWKDYATQWKALSGKDPKYQIASSTGYDRVKSVTRGANDYEFTVVFAKPFSEWKALFSPLYPAKYQDTPEHFNKGYFNDFPLTAGPFKLDKIDKSAKTITVSRDPNWWGTPAKLDKIVYRALEIEAGINAFVNGEVDLVDVGADASHYKKTKGTPGATIHVAGGPDFRHFTINGTAANLKDVKVRQALALGINREAIVKSDLNGLPWPAKTMDNHFFVNTQDGYQDNSGDLGKYDPDRAKELLDEAGWKMSGDFRQKDGKTLELKFIIPSGDPASKQEGELTQAMLKDIGIKLDVKTVPSDAFFDKYVSTGNFDITPFSWLGTAFPISSAVSIYANPKGENIQQNFARNGSPEIDKLMQEAVEAPDTETARAKINEADKLVWQTVHSLVFYQRPQITATKSNLANYGSFGFATKAVIDMGFMK
jgi:peptide/nickel transport system substrate-binding protein